ncbi:type IV pilus modification protein PilV [Hydrogenophaga sp.]|uniref:type IV pilus modification protein PilV n=1 Tax=Hydrogenophaga sp. TaxID=1904254 RepID=UPI00272FA33A|nr:type IV pilus modification protein PilV [Hydrogenophaga sp.]MDP1686746.1 type IV pilus modification protein PilV [Hydrogenophaga sp.]
MKHTKALSNARGATLIEVLITMLVVAVGLLGAAGLQLASTRYQYTSTLRSQAMIQADFIIEKMRVNNFNLTAANLLAAQAAPATAYLAPDDYAAATVLPADPGCGLNAQPLCTPAQAAQRDLREWRQSLARDLPEGRGAIFPVALGGVTEPNARQIVVMWREKSEAETNNVANAAAAEELDATCPGVVVAGIRCLNLWITP